MYLILHYPIKFPILLREELVDEERILTKLPYSLIQLHYLHTQTQSEITDKPGQEGIMTNRYFEVYDASFERSLQNQIFENLKNKNTHLYLATPEEILAGETQTKIKIASNSTSLI